jgi:hypothetical protein
LLTCISFKYAKKVLVFFLFLYLGDSQALVCQSSWDNSHLVEFHSLQLDYNSHSLNQFLKFKHATELLGGLVKIQIAGTIPRVSDSGYLGWSPWSHF